MTRANLTRSDSKSSAEVDGLSVLMVLRGSFWGEGRYFDYCLQQPPHLKGRNHSTVVGISSVRTSLFHWQINQPTKNPPNTSTTTKGGLAPAVFPKQNWGIGGWNVSCGALPLLSLMVSQTNLLLSGACEGRQCCLVTALLPQFLSWRLMVGTGGVLLWIFITSLSNLYVPLTTTTSSVKELILITQYVCHCCCILGIFMILPLSLSLVLTKRNKQSFSICL